MTPVIDRLEKIVSVIHFVVDVDGGRRRITRPRRCDRWSLPSIRASSDATIDDACHQT